MTLVLHLPPVTERKLQELASQSGQDVSEYALGVIQTHLHACSDSESSEADDFFQQAVTRLTERTPEQLAGAREASKRFIRPGKPLPQGASVLDVVFGNWPASPDV